MTHESAMPIVGCIVTNAELVKVCSGLFYITLNNERYVTQQVNRYGMTGQLITLMTVVSS